MSGAWNRAIVVAGQSSIRGGPMGVPPGTKGGATWNLRGCHLGVTFKEGVGRVVAVIEVGRIG